MPAIETPCRNICVVDPRRGLCAGCGRSLDEIERWTAMSNRERRRIMADLPRRMSALAQHRANLTAGEAP